MPGEPGVISYFCDVTVNNLQKTPPRNIKQFGNDNQISETMSGKITGGTHFSDFNEMISSQRFYDSERTKMNFGMRSFANCYQAHCRNDVSPQVHWNTLFPKRNATSLNPGGIQFYDFTVILTALWTSFRPIWIRTPLVWYATFDFM